MVIMGVHYVHYVYYVWDFPRFRHLRRVRICGRGGPKSSRNSVVPGPYDARASQIDDSLCAERKCFPNRTAGTWSHVAVHCGSPLAI